MIRMTKTDAEQFVRSLAPGVPSDAFDWGVEMLLIVSRARGGQGDGDLEGAWGKALEVSTKPHAATLLAAVNAVPPKPQALPSGWETDEEAA